MRRRIRSLLYRQVDERTALFVLWLAAVFVMASLLAIGRL